MAERLGVVRRGKGFLPEPDRVITLGNEGIGRILTMTARPENKNFCADI
jgi:hypothetical protein